MDRCYNCGQFIGDDPHICPNPPVPSRVNPDGSVSVSEYGSGMTVESASKERIISLEQLIEAANIDLTHWEITRHVINKWEIGAKNNSGTIEVEPLYQVKVWLKPIEPLKDAVAFIEDQKQDMIEYAPEYEPIKYGQNEEPHLLVVSLYDLHIGMQTGESSGIYTDHEITAQNASYILDNLLGKVAPFELEAVVLPLGNDFLHADRFNTSGSGGMTTRGTGQNVSADIRELFRYGRQFAVWMIENLKQIAPVTVPVVPGNHDKVSSFHLGDAIESWFHDDPNVRVINTTYPRKYLQYGITLLGYTHGSEEKLKDLPMLMATEAPDKWADTKHREWQIGHRHTKRNHLYTPLTEIDGVRIREIPSIAPRDDWGTSKGYTGDRAAEAYLYHREDGFAGMFSGFIKD